ncbi:MAG: alpha/beta hydrolase [Pyrinomonadaceae bacterium]
MQTKLLKNFRLTLLLIAFVPLAAHAQRDPPVQQFELKSALLARPIEYRILYPVNYQREGNAEKRFPVIYLLHGFSGDNSNWLEKSRVALYATHFDVFIVMVEGDNGWYTDSASVPTDKYESYIIKELIPEIEQRFRVSREREGRAIAGLSMGGYGALKFGLKYPEKFSLVASMSGAFDAASWTDSDLKTFEFIRQSIQKTFGPPNSPTRLSNDLIRITRAASPEQIKQLPFVYFDCGTEDFLFQTNRDFLALLVERKIPHEFRQLPGTHSWPYWDQQIEEILRLTARRLAPPK